MVLFQWMAHFGNGQLILLNLNIKLVFAFFPLRFLVREFTFSAHQVIFELVYGQKTQAYSLGQNFLKEPSCRKSAMEGFKKLWS